MTVAHDPAAAGRTHQLPTAKGDETGLELHEAAEPSHDRRLPRTRAASSPPPCGGSSVSSIPAARISEFPNAPYQPRREYGSCAKHGSQPERTLHREGGRKNPANVFPLKGTKAIPTRQRSSEARESGPHFVVRRTARRCTPDARARGRRAPICASQPHHTCLFFEYLAVRSAAEGVDEAGGNCRSSAKGRRLTPWRSASDGSTISAR
jgi:hypothetical protein